MAIRPIPLPSVAFLKECLSYDAYTGLLLWRVRPLHHFSGKYQARTHKIWNTRYAGTPAFNHVCSTHGYRVGRLGQINYLAHRVIWKLVTGEEAITIDHINGVRSDNRFANLRSVTVSLNQRNRQVRRDSTSGVLGVYYVPKTGNYQSTIRVGKKYKYLGTFSKIEDAADARAKAEKKYGYIARTNNPQRKVEL